MYSGNNKAFPITSKGDSAFIRYSAHADGTDFTEEWNEGQNYIGFATGQTAPLDHEGYKWCKFTGEEGTSGDSVFIRYSADADPYGTDFTETWSEGQNYIGIATGQTAPTHKMDYAWYKFIGEGGDVDLDELDKRYMVKHKPNASYDTVGVLDHNGNLKVVRIHYGNPGEKALAGYDTGGVLKTNEPTADLHCANKKYVDDAIAEKLNNVSTSEWQFLTELTSASDSFNIGFSDCLISIQTNSGNYSTILTLNGTVSDRPIVSPDIRINGKDCYIESAEGIAKFKLRNNTTWNYETEGHIYIYARPILTGSNSGGAGSGGYTVTVIAEYLSGRGLSVKSNDLPSTETDTTWGAQYDGEEHVFTDVNKLYFWTTSGCSMTVSKNGEALIQGDWNDSCVFSNVSNNVVQITEDCTITVTVEY